MIKIRTTFQKTDRAKYISHLDLMRCMQRAMKRARIPVWYTEGFNPHAYIMFPLALSLGVKSECEIMDFTLTEEMPFDEIKSRMNQALPLGLQIMTVSVPEKKHTEIAFAEYKLAFEQLSDSKLFLEKLHEFLNQETIPVEKRSKKRGGTVTTDIKPQIVLTEEKSAYDSVFLTVRLPAGTSVNLNPGVVIDAFSAYSQLEFPVIRIERTKILCADGKTFS